MSAVGTSSPSFLFFTYRIVLEQVIHRVVPEAGWMYIRFTLCFGQ